MRFVASTAIISGFISINASTSFKVGVIYTSELSYTSLIIPMIGSETFFLISRISSTVFARIPAAPPSYAALAIRPIINDECKGSSSSA